MCHCGCRVLNRAKGQSCMVVQSCVIVQRQREICIDFLAFVILLKKNVRCDLDSRHCTITRLAKNILRTVCRCSHWLLYAFPLLEFEFTMLTLRCFYFHCLLLLSVAKGFVCKCEVIVQGEYYGATFLWSDGSLVVGEPCSRRVVCRTT